MFRFTLIYGPDHEAEMAEDGEHDCLVHGDSLLWSNPKDCDAYSGSPSTGFAPGICAP